LSPLSTIAMALVLVACSMISRGGFAAAAGGGTVYVHLHPCEAAGTTKYNQDYTSLMNLCDDDAVYFGFALTSEGVSYSGQETSGNPLERTFNDVPAHIFTIEGQSVPYSAEPVVYCQNGDGSSDGAYIRMEVGASPYGFAIHPTMGASAYIVCDWFAGVPDQSVDMSGSVTIHQHACPNGVDLAGSDLATLAASCMDAITPATLSIASYLNAPQAQMTGTQIGDGAYWQYLSPDFVQITSDATSASRAFCKGTVQGGGNFAMAEIPAAQNTFAYNLVSGEHLICDWYAGPAMQAEQQAQTNQDAQPTSDANNADNGDNADNGGDQDQQNGDQQPAAGVGAISITVYTCPVGFDPTVEDFSSLQASCQEGGNGFDFTLNAGDSVSTETSGQYANQGVYWDGIGAGDVVVQESIPSGLGSPFFSCPGWNGVSGDGSIVLTVNDGETLSCDWFNTQP
jgi:hypothetical protein